MQKDQADLEADRNDSERVKRYLLRRKEIEAHCIQEQKTTAACNTKIMEMEENMQNDQKLLEQKDQKLADKDKII